MAAESDVALLTVDGVLSICKAVAPALIAA